MPGNYRYIPEEQKKLVLTMSLRGMSASKIEKATGILLNQEWKVQTNKGAIAKSGALSRVLHTAGS
jgi:hypothetical protein